MLSLRSIWRGGCAPPAPYRSAQAPFGTSPDDDVEFVRVLRLRPADCRAACVPWVKRDQIGADERPPGLTKHPRYRLPCRSPLRGRQRSGHRRGPGRPRILVEVQALISVRNSAPPKPHSSSREIVGIVLAVAGCAARQLRLSGSRKTARRQVRSTTSRSPRFPIRTQSWWR